MKNQKKKSMFQRVKFVFALLMLSSVFACSEAPSPAVEDPYKPSKPKFRILATEDPYLPTKPKP